MAILTQAERDSLASIIRTLEVGSAGKFISSNEIERLSRIFRDKCGFNCGCGQSNSGSVTSFNTGMRDAPFATLLKVILCGSEGLITVPPGALTSAQLNTLLADLCPPPANLGTVIDFGLLGATTDTNTGNTIVDGDLGLSPGTSVVGYPPGIVLGTQHVNDAAAAQAQSDATVAYNALVALGPGTLLSADIGGQTLAPGTYHSATTLGITGDLLLDAQGDPCATWNIHVGSALTTAASSRVVLLNGALARNVYWSVGTSATLGTNSVFRGTLIALASITTNTSAFIEGRLIARTGAVSTDAAVIELPI